MQYVAARYVRLPTGMTDGAQLLMDSILAQAPELPSVLVLSLWGSPPQRMFLKKHLDARLKPWSS